MERARDSIGGRPPGLPLHWRVTGQYLPLLAILLAAFLIVRNLAGEGASKPEPARVDPVHSQRLAENIAFFEGRVAETNDSLSYNRLTQLYLQRQRETGDPADIGRAELSATRSLEVAPGGYAGLVNLALVRLAQHEFDEALGAAEEAVARFPDATDAYAVRGDALLALGRYDEAGADYRRVLELTPGPGAYARNAALAEVRGEAEVAAQFWQAAIDSDIQDAPEASAWARVQLANLRFNTGSLEDAREQYETALRVFPGYGAAEAGLGRVAAAERDFDDAIRHFAAAAERLPLPEYVATLGDLYALGGDAPEAERQYALVRAIGELSAASGIRDDLTLILFELDHGGDVPALMAQARAAYEGRPSLAAADVYGWALYRAGQIEEARALADEATREGSVEPLYYFHAAVIADAQGDEGAMRTFAQRLAELNPRFAALHAGEAERLTRKAGVK